MENASTLSRLHVLLGIMDASIKWEKSAENAVSLLMLPLSLFIIQDENVRNLKALNEVL